MHKGISKLPMSNIKWNLKKSLKNPEKDGQS